MTLHGFRFPRAASRGFTLIQVLITVAIVAVAIIPASSVFTASTRNVQRGDLRLTAAMAAQSLLDDLRLRMAIFDIPEDHLPLPTPKLPGLEVPELLLAVLQASSEVRFKKDEHYPEIAREVTVVVRYREYGIERETLLSTIVTDTRDRHLRKTP